MYDPFKLSVMFAGNVLVLEITNPPPTLNVGLAAVVIVLPAAFVRVVPIFNVVAAVAIVKPALFVRFPARVKLVTLLKLSAPLLMKLPNPLSPKTTEVIVVALVNVIVVLFVKSPFSASVVASPEKEPLLVNVPSILNVAVPVPTVIVPLLVR